MKLDEKPANINFDGLNRIRSRSRRSLGGRIRPDMANSSPRIDELFFWTPYIFPNLLQMAHTRVLSIAVDLEMAHTRFLSLVVTFTTS